MNRHALAARMVLLTGPMGVGKSTVGRLAASMSGAPFVDLDDVVSAAAGRSVAEIFAAEGESGFRNREREALERVLEAQAHGVVALGGGALLEPAVRRRALERGCVVALDASSATLHDRTRGATRPLLGADDVRAENLARLLAARRAVYAEAHAVLSTENAAPEAVAARVLDLWQRPVLAVPLGERTYSVELARDDRTVGRMVAAHDRTGVFVVTDHNVEPRWGDALRHALLEVGIEPRATVSLPPGEAEKHLGSVEAVLRGFIEAGADRDALVVGHGGGVVTDIAGFCAATLLRGVRWVAIPTTLLAIVDASVGGKTGVDLGKAKNAIGAFHQPVGVVVDVSRVATESPRGFRSGLAEVVKAACIADAELFATLEQSAEPLQRRERVAVEAAAWGALRVKAAIVGRDEHEVGERALLNFGHTIGHALEMGDGIGTRTHGEAVALGMVAALQIGEALGVTPASVVARTVSLLDRLGLPTRLDREALRRALPLVGFDKKRRGELLRFVVLREIGAAELRQVEAAALPRLLAPLLDA